MTRALSTGTFLVAALLYAAASVLFYVEVARREVRGGITTKPPATPGRAARLAPLLLGAAAMGHAAYVTLASLVARVCPINSVHFSLSVASLLAIGVFLPARRRFHIDALGVLVAPLGLVFLLGTFFLGTATPSPSLGPFFIGLHVLANLLGTALFLLAGGAAALYLVQEKRLKKKRPTGRSNLPPLEALDKAVHRFLIAGFPAFTVGIVSGTFWAQKLETGTPDEILRIVLGYATWLLIATVLLLRAAAGFRGRRAAYGTLVGFVCVAAVLIVYLVRPVPPLGAGRIGG
jgi:ABC-type uncharacterized transport system permease subunit